MHLSSHHLKLLVLTEDNCINSFPKLLVAPFDICARRSRLIMCSLTSSGSSAMTVQGVASRSRAEPKKQSLALRLSLQAKRRAASSKQSSM